MNNSCRRLFQLSKRIWQISDFTVEALSKEMGMSRTLLYKKLLALTGKPPLEFIQIIKTETCCTTFAEKPA